MMKAQSFSDILAGVKPRGPEGERSCRKCRHCRVEYDWDELSLTSPAFYDCGKRSGMANLPSFPFLQTRCRDWELKGSK